MILLHPTDVSTGHQVELTSTTRPLSPRQALLRAYATIERADFKPPSYESSYGSLIETRPSHIPGYALLQLGNWKIHEPIANLA